MSKVLLIDDSKTIQKVAALILKGSKYKLLTADDSQQGERVALEQRPEVSLVDLTISPINGLELIRKLKNHPDLKEMKLALLYSHFKNVPDEDLKKVGAHGKLAKPFDSGAFLNLLKELEAFSQLKTTISAPHKVPPPPEKFENLFTEEELDKSLDFLEKPLSESLKESITEEALQLEDIVVTPAIAADERLSQSIPRDAIEKVCREVIPGIAEKIIREEIQRLIKDSD